MDNIQPNRHLSWPSSNNSSNISPPSSESVNKFNNILEGTNDSDSKCSFSSYANNIAVGATVGVGAGAVPCVFSGGAYIGCVGLAGVGGAAGGAFQSAVECTDELINR